MKTKENNITVQSEEAKTKELAEKYKVPYIDLTSIALERDFIQSLPVEFLYRANFVPIEENKNSVKIAIADPSDIEAIDSIESFLGKKVEVYAASKRGINEALRKSETALQVL